MLLLKEDISRIVKTGLKEESFVIESEGFKSLRNKNGRCVFHDGSKCTIYSIRPSGCKLYPIVFDENLCRPIIDSFCPFGYEFHLSINATYESEKLYQKLLKRNKIT